MNLRSRLKRLSHLYTEPGPAAAGAARAAAIEQLLAYDGRDPDTLYRQRRVREILEAARRRRDRASGLT